jgi:hypothetical protein
MKEFTLLKKYSSMRDLEFNAVNTEGISNAIQKVLVVCEIGSLMKEDIMLNKPRYLNETNSINDQREIVQRRLDKININSDIKNPYKHLVDETILLYNRSIIFILEVTYRENGTMD